MSAAPLLRTARLELWQPQVGDLPALIELVAHDETRRFLGPQKRDASAQFDRLLRQAGSWSLYGYGSLFARLPGEAAIIGSVGVFHTWRGFGQGMDDAAEAGWIIHHDHWGKGYAGEAMRAALGWFDATHGPRRVAAMIEEGNTASQKVALGLGFAECGRHQLDDGAPLVLYERVDGCESETASITSGPTA
jgi:RimJ/RimL family protein N-acetyltransferase